MKPNLSSVLAGMLLLPSCLFTAHSQSFPPQLRLDRRTNALELTVSSLSATGALFIYQAPDLQTLVDSPSLLFETNTVSTNNVRVPIASPGGPANATFFSAANWPGYSTNDFVYPEEYPIEPVPDKILFTSDLPPNLGAGSAFIVDFFVASPSGQPVAISGTATILVVRESDGATHPDAIVAPTAGQMTNGYMRAVITVNSTTSLVGYTLGLSIAPGVLGSPHPLVTSTFLKAVFGLGAPKLTPPHDEAYWTQKLEERRTVNRDTDQTWSYPLAGSGHLVSGTFGEWRGKKTEKEPTGHVHEGLDLSTADNADIAVKASRGGVISRSNSIPNMGSYLVVDHGDGWFSRYLHLDPAFFSVSNGQAVARGDKLATRLYKRAHWGVHLHFEVRKGPNTSQWENPYPGIGQDPLQTDGLFPENPVPVATARPLLEGFGLTRQPPWKTPFLKGPPTVSDSGPVHLVAQFVDSETIGNRLGLRTVRFVPDVPEGVPLPPDIWPINETADNLLRPPDSDHINSFAQINGFAKYPNDHFTGELPTAVARLNYYRYWWQWDTSSYAATRTGPRSLVLSGTNYSGASREFAFTFGPKLLGVTPDLLVAGQYFFTNVAYLGTNRFSELNKPDPAMTQPDRYKLEIVWDDGVTVLPGVMWVSPITSYAAYGLTPVLATHLQANTFSFTLPQTTPPTPGDGLKLRVSSLLVPNIAHEVALLPTCPVGPAVIPGPNMALIPAGPFTMGNCMDPGEGYSDELPLHTVYVSAFYMDKYEVTKALWDEVYNWALTHSYSFTYGAAGKAVNHPAQSMTWYDAVMWCNARSEKEGRVPAYYTSAAQTAVYRGGQVNVDNNWVKWCTGYRLPTEAEWEKAARGGLSGQRFPWGNTISWSQANHYAYPLSAGGYGYGYDVNPTQGYHPTFDDGVYPYTSPVGYFGSNGNGYGLYDMAGNVWEWCWDRYGGYSSGSQTDPHGPAPGSSRGLRGGSWNGNAFNCRTAFRYSYYPTGSYNYVGFRPVLPPGQ